MCVKSEQVFLILHVCMSAYKSARIGEGQVSVWFHNEEETLWLWFQCVLVLMSHKLDLLCWDVSEDV